MNTWRPPQHIRPIAIALVRNNDRLLVMAVRDDDGVVKGWRPPGGGIEFGERAIDAVQREFREEFALGLKDVSLCAVMENIFTHGGVQGHEIVHVFDARFADEAAYSIEEFSFEDGGVRNDCRWVSIAAFTSDRETLFPDSLVTYLNPS